MAWPCRILGLLLVCLFYCPGQKLTAQELTFLGGFLPSSDSERSSYTWQIDYRQDLYQDFAASISYINEGHLRAHHRDGTAWQVWGRLPLSLGKVSVSLGLGGYYYFDTQPRPGGLTADVHGVAPIFSFSATRYLSDRWFYQLMLNRITPAYDVQVSTVSVGAGVWFGQEGKPTSSKLGDAPEEYGFVTENELTVFFGQSVVNTFLSQSARAFAGEYRRGLLPHLDWTVALIHEGDPKIIRRSGLATQLWAVNTFFNEQIAVGAGLGPYVYLDRRNPPNPNQQIPAAVAPLASLTFSVKLAGPWTMRLVFDRVLSNYNRDADIFLLGLGCRWPR